MVDQIKALMKRNGLIISIYLILLIIVTNSVFMVFSRKGTSESLKMKEQVLKANQGIQLMNTHVHLADLGLRGYIIIQDEKLLASYNGAMADYQNNFDELRVVLSAQGFDLSILDQAEQAVVTYMKLLQQMVQMCAVGNVDEVVSILREDPGSDAWKIYSVFERTALEFENQLSEQADKTHKTMTVRMIIAQSILILVGIPTLILVIIVLKKDKKSRTNLFNNHLLRNKKYIFDSGEKIEDDNEKQMIEELFTNLKKATRFINNITKGNYDISWKGLTKENAVLNKDNIAGELIAMLDQMKKVKAEDEIRIWSTQGLSDFAETVRSNQHDFKVLAEDLIHNLVKYLKAQQGGLFIVNIENENDAHLELMGCYAYDRIKSMEKRIEFGQSLVGQSYLEKESIYMTEVPQEFVNISSGLGDTRPDCILIVPLKFNDKIEGVIELASLKPFKNHEIKFVEKLGETIASAITTVRVAENTKILLEQSQQQTEEMRAQEEEMRQNMEELQATQEQIQRNSEEMNAQKAIIENKKKTDAILENSQEAIVLISKKTGKIDIANTMATKFTGYSQEELTGLEYNTIFKFLKIDKIKQGDKKRQKLIRKDRSKFMADIFVGEEIISDEEMFLLFVKDVTLQIKQEQETIMSLETAEQQKRKLQMQENELHQNMEEMKAQEEELRQNMEEMQATQEEMEKAQKAIIENKKKTDTILENSQEAIVLISKETEKIDITNTMMTTLTGYSKKELTGLEIKKIFKFLKLNQIKQGDKKRQKLIRKDQSKFMANIFVGEETINGEDVFLLFVKDVTQQIKQEQEVVMTLEETTRQKREYELEIKSLKNKLK